MQPQISFKHVLSELSVNRTDPCEVVRELISNSYDAKAKNIRYAGIASIRGFIYWDNGIGLSRTEKINDITPWEAFFSIGKSTKIKGDSIGYKCQGSKLCFASNRILVLTRTQQDNEWYWHAIENPRNTLGPDIDISPTSTLTPWENLTHFMGQSATDVTKALNEFKKDFFEEKFKSGTLIAIQNLDVDSFTKHLLGTAPTTNCYLFNYIRFTTKQGDTRKILDSQGFKASHLKQLNTGLPECNFELFDGESFSSIPFGFPYLAASSEIDIKSPLEVARLRDGRFNTRYAKKFKYGNNSYCLILAIDGNRKAHDGYPALDRKGASKSGLRLSDQRGVAISVNGIKVCRYNEIFQRPELEKYSILGDSESSSHYLLIIDGPFDLVTNRNTVSKSAASIFEDGGFINEIKKFLDDAIQNEKIFYELVGRLSREQREAKLNQQIEILDNTKNNLQHRERFRIPTSTGEELYVSPLPGEEYLVGVLYASLRDKTPIGNSYEKYWKKVFTFSTLGIDSIGSTEQSSIAKDHLISVEYKYEFSNSGPFNHALCIVDFIVAWNVKLNTDDTISDDYNCFGTVRIKEEGIYEIFDIEDNNGSTYQGHIVTVVNLKNLINKTWPSISFKTPPKK